MFGREIFEKFFCAWRSFCSFEFVCERGEKRERERGRERETKREREGERERERERGKRSCRHFCFFLSSEKKISSKQNKKIFLRQKKVMAAWRTFLLKFFHAVGSTVLDKRLNWNTWHFLYWHLKFERYFDLFVNVGSHNFLSVTFLMTQQSSVEY